MISTGFSWFLRADLDVSRRYAASDPAELPCQVTAIGWSEKPDITPELMGGTRFVVVPGRRHRFIDAPPDLIGRLSRLGQR